MHGKIGILNVQFVDNYGAVLLAYALQKTIEDLGYNVETIDYRPSQDRSLKSKMRKIVSILKVDGIQGLITKIQKKIMKRNCPFSVNNSSREKKRNFSKFRCQYLNRSKVYDMTSIQEALDYDIYVVGSDVVWKPDRIKSEESRAYFLEFTIGKLCRRISYAASIGTDDMDILKPLESRISCMIQKFDCVSVREKTSQPFVERLYGNSVSCCIDPTLLLGKEIYDVLIGQEGETLCAREYLYLYLFEDNAAAFDFVNSCSETLGIPVVCQCSAPEKVKNLLEYSCDDGPIEFLRRIKNAKFVITDSFHGTVFSVLYKKDFYTVSRGAISIRMEDLLERLGLKDRYIYEPRKQVQEFKPVYYNAVDEIINDWRKESMDYLKKALSGN